MGMQFGEEEVDEMMREIDVDGNCVLFIKQC